jgi:16S rRNA (cytidine1402-2'-O)-methyltransferase
VIAKGRLTLVGTPIGNLEDLSPRAARALTELTVIACEDTRRTGKLLAHLGVSGKKLLVANEHTEASVAERIIEYLSQATGVGLVSDAGMPSISDPGQRIVSAVIEAGYQVDVVPGPTAVSAALVVSGFSSERFVFEGFLPRKGEGRRSRLEQLTSETRTAVIYESPNRLVETLSEMGRVLGVARRVFVGRELTKMYQQLWRGTLGDGPEFWSSQGVKGEIVVVLEGVPAERGPVADAEIIEALSGALSAGNSKRDAVAEVVSLTGEPKRRVYDLALGLPGPSST